MSSTFLPFLRLAQQAPVAAGVQDQYCEVVMGANNEHRADILGSDNTVIEIQRSIIDIRDSRDRIEFYKNATGRRVIWVVDIQEFWRKRFFLSARPDSNGFYTVTWKPKRTWLWDIAATPDTNLFLEFNQSSDKLLQAWIHQGTAERCVDTRSNSGAFRGMGGLFALHVGLLWYAYESVKNLH